MQRGAIAADPVGQANATTIYLKKDLRVARQAIKDLDASVQSASSFREECAGLLEECERALGRLEQVRCPCMILV
jgi:hypothetical protein